MFLESALSRVMVCDDKTWRPGTARGVRQSDSKLMPSKVHKASKDWSELVSEQEWSYCREILSEAKRRGISFAVGGGLAFSVYADRIRNTKDVDIFILPKDRDAMIEITATLGFADYYEQLPYERHWLYRAHRNGVIVDLMWRMANDRAEVDEGWLKGGLTVSIHGDDMPLLPREELIWSKLYVLQRDRSDWPDILNILLIEAASLDWQRLLEKVGDDARLLGGIILVFSWLCPEKAASLPKWIWERMGIGPLPLDPERDVECRRTRLLDTRDWFGPRHRNSP